VCENPKNTADLSTPLRSGRDDNSVVADIPYFLLETRNSVLQQNCHLDRSAAEWRDLRFWGFPITLKSAKILCPYTPSRGLLRRTKSVSWVGSASHSIAMVVTG
jgi:hypothetical protein